MPKDIITDEEKIFGKTAVAGGSVFYENSMLSNQQSISAAEFKKRKTEFESVYGDYTEQNLAKFRQDKEGGVSGKEAVSRVLEKTISNYAAGDLGDKQVGQIYSSFSELKDAFIKFEPDFSNVQLINSSCACLNWMNFECIHCIQK